MNSESEKPELAHVDFVRAAVNDQVQRNYDAIEAMCWKMLAQTDTRYGVLVEPQPDGTVKVSLSPDAEFMKVSWMPRLIGGLSRGE